MSRSTSSQFPESNAPLADFGLGPDLAGVICLHGILSATLPAKARDVNAKVLVLHGDADPIAPFEQLTSFRTEMLAAQANWEINIYGNARHSFTGEGVSDQSSPETGLHSQSESRSWGSDCAISRGGPRIGFLLTQHCSKVHPNPTLSSGEPSSDYLRISKCKLLFGRQLEAQPLRSLLRDLLQR